MFRHKTLQVHPLQLQLREQIHAQQPYEVPHQRVPVSLRRLHVSKLYSGTRASIHKAILPKPKPPKRLVF
jgi:hypothetical protein